MRSIVVTSLLAFTMYFGLGAHHALAEKQNLIFGAIAVGKVSQVKNSLQPFMQYLEKETGTKISFETGKDYPDTIAKFKSGYFDFGYIGPSPYVIATSDGKGVDTFKIIAGIETNGSPHFQAVIIAAKDNGNINSLGDLKQKRFAFGSRQSTLSCYMPCKMLLDAGVFKTLSGYDFLEKHDKVIRDVAMGGFDAGGVKIDVANQHLDTIKIIAKSDPVYDFLLVAHQSMDNAQYQKIKSATLQLKDPAILGNITKGATGFVETSDANYDNLRTVMKQVDKVLPQ